MQFTDLIGKQILAAVPVFSDKELQQITVRGVDFGGLWIESEDQKQLLLERSGLPAIYTPIFFLPYHEIRYAFAKLESLELSEKKFGV